MLATCQLGYLPRQARRFGYQLHHQLFDPFDRRISTLDASINPDDYDAIIVSVVFRNLLKTAIGRNTDVLHARGASPEEMMDAGARCADLLRAELEGLHGSLKARPTFVCNFPEPSFRYTGSFITASNPVSMRTLVRALNDRLEGILAGLDGFHLLDINEMYNFVGRAHIQDDITVNATHMSVIGDDGWSDDRRILPPISNYAIFDTKSHLLALGEVVFNELADRLKILRQQDSVKLIIVDLDDTLWRGVAAEDESGSFAWSDERTEGWPLGFVEALLYFKQRGGMLAICSKNDHELTATRFRTLWRDEITLGDFVSVKINWKPKSENIAEILSEINVLPESTLFIDDNPREIDEVRSRYPTLRCLGGNHKDWRRIILRSPETQVPFISAESQARTQLVQARITRDIESRSMSRDEWLAGLALQQKVLLVDSVRNPMFPRAMELINKTNQFNTTGKRWTLAELEAHFAGKGVCLVTSLKDKTADNGIIGAALIRESEIVQVVLSCRVFGLGAEIAMGRLAILMGLANHAVVRARVIDTGRNFICHSYFDSLGFVSVPDGYEATHACEYPAWIEVETDPGLKRLL